MGVEGVVLLVAPEGEGGMRRFPPTLLTKENFYLDGEGLVAVVAFDVAGAASCLSFESGSAVPLVSSSSS